MLQPWFVLEFILSILSALRVFLGTWYGWNEKSR